MCQAEGAKNLKSYSTNHNDVLPILLLLSACDNQNSSPWTQDFAVYVTDALSLNRALAATLSVGTLEMGLLSLYLIILHTITNGQYP